MTEEKLGICRCFTALPRTELSYLGFVFPDMLRKHPRFERDVYKSWVRDRGIRIFITKITENKLIQAICYCPGFSGLKPRQLHKK